MTPDALARVQWLIERRRYADAEAALRRHLAANPTDADAHLFLAHALLLSDRPTEALPEARAAVAGAPGSSVTHRMLSAVLARAGDFGAAESPAREAVRLAPDDPDSWATLSAAFINLRRPADALDAAETGLRLNPEHAGSAQMRAMALVHRRDLRAPNAAVEALRLDPVHPNALAAHLQALGVAGRTEEAMAALPGAVRNAPADPFLRFAAIEVLVSAFPVLHGWPTVRLWSRAASRALWSAAALAAVAVLSALLLPVLLGAPVERASVFEGVNGAVVWALVVAWGAAVLGAHAFDPAFDTGPYLLAPPDPRRWTWGYILFQLLWLGLPAALVFTGCAAANTSRWTPAAWMVVALVTILALGARALWFRGAWLDVALIVVLIVPAPLIVASSLFDETSRALLPVLFAFALVLAARGLVALFRPPPP